MSFLSCSNNSPLFSHTYILANLKHTVIYKCWDILLYQLTPKHNNFHLKKDAKKNLGFKKLMCNISIFLGDFLNL